MTTPAKREASPEQQLFALAYTSARRVGLGREESQDCAIEFAERMLATRPSPQHPDPGTDRYAAWLQQCAYNHACNHLRTLSRRRQTERSWTESFGPSAERFAQSCPAGGAGPRTLTLRRELWGQLAAALKQLAPAQRELFLRYHLRSHSLQDLAARFQRTPHAVEVSLSHTRRRLAQLLTIRGWSVADIHALFHARGQVASKPPRC